MGIDINVMIEYRMPNSNHFNYFNIEPLSFSGNYLMFSLMADVRTPKGLDPLFKAKGLPPDMPLSSTRSTGRYSDFEHDGFSMSWLTRDEYHEVLKAYLDYESKLAFDYAVLGDLLNSFISNGADMSRIVFWFDY